MLPGGTVKGMAPRAPLSLALLLLIGCAPSHAVSPTAAPASGNVIGAPAADLTIYGREAAPGEVLLLAVNRRDLTTAPTGTLDGKPLLFYRVSTGGWAALAAFDLDVTLGAKALSLTLTTAAGASAVSRSIVVRPKSFPTVNLRVDDRYVRLSPADQARVDGEQALTRRLYAARGPGVFSGSFVSPIPGATAARFGERRVFNGVPKDPHNGADLRAGTGEPVHAASAGTVVLARDLFYSGNTVILDHGLGLFSLYAHLSRIDVAEGQATNARDVVGLVGATGRVTGPHLHWGTKFQGARIDPFSLVALPLNDHRP